jgi:DNA-dependent RNA polymerase auxiliary subunit epsilon
MKYFVDVGVATDSWEEWDKVNEVTERAAGKQAESAGTGFGVRDQQFYFETESETQAKAIVIRQALEDANLKVEYCVATNDPETSEEMRAEGWTEEDIEDFFKE